MRISEIMTADVRAIAPDRTVRDAARLMDELNVGVLPVCEGERLVGVVTDRDITVRSTAAGLAPAQHAVREIMTTQPASCRPDDDSSDVLRRMSELQVRRIPVVEASGRLVGMVSLGDLADDRVPGAGEALRRISTPAEPDRTGTPSTRRADAARDERPSPLTEEERRELARRASQPDEPRRDGGRAPDPAQGGGDAHGGFAPRDEDDARAAFGIAGAPTQAGESPGRMRGGFGGEGYSEYGRNFGRDADQPAQTPLVDAGRFGGAVREAAADQRNSPPRPSPQEARPGRTVFTGTGGDMAGGEGAEDAPQSGADIAHKTGNPGTSGGTAGGIGGSPSGGRSTDE